MTTKLTLEKSSQQTLKKFRLRATRPAGCESIELYLFDPDVLDGPISHDEAQAVVERPAYWSFSWASGQVLAEFILNNPDWVKNKHVADIGSGSGIVAIAAAKAGAKKVWACDIDDEALIACKLNAELNDCLLETAKDFQEIETELDLILAADVLYDRDNYPLLETFKRFTKAILIADSRVKIFPDQSYRKIATHKARTWPDLNEFEEFNLVSLYQHA